MVEEKLGETSCQVDSQDKELYASDVLQIRHCCTSPSRCGDVYTKLCGRQRFTFTSKNATFFQLAGDCTVLPLPLLKSAPSIEYFPVCHQKAQKRGTPPPMRPAPTPRRNLTRLSKNKTCPSPSSHTPSHTSQRACTAASQTQALHKICPPAYGRTPLLKSSHRAEQPLPSNHHPSPLCP